MTTPPEWETVVRGWLSRIGERDQDTVAEVIERCQQDEAARDYFIGRMAESMPTTGKEIEK
jgi:hypothetical protein